jgi:hypothetical protein
MSDSEERVCAFCGDPAEGNYAIHRDGFGIGPEVDLCDECGQYPKPTCEDIWEEISQHDTSNVYSLSAARLFRFLKGKLAEGDQ